MAALAVIHPRKKESRSMVCSVQGLADSGGLGSGIQCVGVQHSSRSFGSLLLYHVPPCREAQMSSLGFDGSPHSYPATNT